MRTRLWLALSLGLSMPLLNGCGAACEAEQICTAKSDKALSNNKIQPMCGVEAQHTGNSLYTWKTGDGDCTCVLDDTRAGVTLWRACTFTPTN